MQMNNKSQWLADRKKYLGGTDMAAICGQTEACSAARKTPFQVYLDKVSVDIQENDSFAAEWGRRHEKTIAEKYAEDTGHIVEESTGPIYHKDYEFLAANIDRWVTDKNTGERYILECKTADRSKSSNWGVPGSSNIPDGYLIQVAWYAAICDVSKVDIAVLIGGNDYRVYTYKRDKELEESLIRNGVRFWKEAIVKGIEPTPINTQDWLLKYKKGNDTNVIANNEISGDVTYLRQLKEIEKELSQKIEETTNKVKLFMKDNNLLLDDQGNCLVSWKNNKPKKYFDIKKFEKEQQDMYSAYSKEIEGCRVFLLKN